MMIVTWVMIFFLHMLKCYLQNIISREMGSHDSFTQDSYKMSVLFDTLIRFMYIYGSGCSIKKHEHFVRLLNWNCHCCLSITAIYIEQITCGPVLVNFIAQITIMISWISWSKYYSWILKFNLSSRFVYISFVLE